MNRAIRLMMLALSALLIFTPACYAGIKGGSRTIPSVTVDIPVSHEIRGNYSGNDLFSFTLKAMDPENPMPRGSENGVKTVNVKGRFPVDFGDISFEYPDAYYYEISRKARKTDTVSMEDKTYSVMIAVYNDGTSQMVTWEKATSEKTEGVVFRDTAVNAAGRPKTGDFDGAGLAASAAMLVSSAIAYAALAGMRKKGERVHEE
jgi:hypothetical protein